MSAKTIGAIVLVLAVIAGVWFVYAGMRGNTDDVAVRATVTNFGAQLQKVSLLAPDADQQIASVYGPYVASSLISTWQQDPSKAPGRQTSSPWPDHIDINGVTKGSNHTFTVTGSVVLMTSNEVSHGGNAGTIPVTLMLEKQSGKWVITSYQEGQPQAPSTTTATSGNQTQKAYTHSNPTFSFMYGNAFTLAEGAPSGQTAGYWSALANPSVMGTTYVTLTLPKDVQPNTNFSDARLTVGRSADANAVATCLAASNGNPAQTSKVTSNGVAYTVITTSDAGAGNLYTTTSYRTVRDNACYSVEYTVHTTNIANYPAGTVHEYDANALKAMLDGVVQSFTFSAA